MVGWGGEHQGRKQNRMGRKKRERKEMTEKGRENEKKNARKKKPTREKLVGHFLLIQKRSKGKIKCKKWQSRKANDGEKKKEIKMEHTTLRSLKREQRWAAIKREV